MAVLCDDTPVVGGSLGQALLRIGGGTEVGGHGAEAARISTEKDVVGDRVLRIRIAACPGEDHGVSLICKDWNRVPSIGRHGIRGNVWRLTGAIDDDIVPFPAVIAVIVVSVSLELDHEGAGVAE